ILVNEPPLTRSWGRDLVRRLLLIPLQMSAKGVLVYGSKQRAAYYRSLIPDARVKVTPQYQNLAPLLAIQKSPRGGGQPLVRFFYAGRLETFSGVDLVVRAFNKVGAENPRTTLDILGSGSQRPQLESLVAASVRDRVTFHGAVEREVVPAKFAIGD